MRITSFLAATVSSLALVIASSALSQPRHHGSSAYTPDFTDDQAVLSLTDQSGQIEGRFGRMFALNSPYNKQGDTLTPHPSPIYDLLRLGEAGGAMEEDDSAVGDGKAPAGVTFFGQFVDHDITLDVTTQLDRPAVPEDIPNQRTINLDLDCVYGAGPEANPYLYALPKLAVGDAIGATGRYDLPRFNGVALIGDPRNDENVVVSQLQSAFITFHNAMVDELLVDKGLEGEVLSPQEQRDIFEEARDHVIHYYHRLLIEDFLPQVIGIQRTVDIAQNGRRFYFPQGFYDNDDQNIQRPFMPIEFSVAAYRFGHSQVRHAYMLNGTRVDVPLFDPAGLMGFRAINEQDVIDWHYFFAVDESSVTPQKARRIDTKLPGHLFRLDMVGVVPEGDLGSLAGRNLNRGRIYRLPSGQQLAERMGFSPVDADQAVSQTLAINQTPLWYYILQEASHVETGWNSKDLFFVEKDEGGKELLMSEIRSAYKSNDEKGATSDFGNILGPVGGTIVGEVIAGLIDHYREATGKGLDFVPTISIGSKDTEAFGHRIQMQHMLTFAGLL